MKPIRDQIRDYLQENHMSVYALSKKAGIVQSILSLFLRDKRGMTVETWEKIAKAMGK